MAPTIYNINNAVYRDKMASFDYDWTLVNPKQGNTFPLNIDDWQWSFPSVPVKIKQYYLDGYMIVIFTNQSKTWKCEQVQLVAKLLDIPIFVVIATDKCDYKPNIILYDTLMSNNNNNNHNINKEQSFFVGDALGRKIDFSDSDKIFAINIGISWHSPESIFNTVNKEFILPIISLEIEQKNEPDIKLEIEPEIKLEIEPEIIIMMGYPSSGKSTIAKKICENDKYIHIEGDVYKTTKHMIKHSLEHILHNKSIVFDATNSSIKKRREYVDLGKKYCYKITCIHVSTSLLISYQRNKERNETKQVPKIAYSVYTKYYEEPTESENFKLITI